MTKKKKPAKKAEKANNIKPIDIEAAALEFVEKLVQPYEGSTSKKYHLLRLLDIKPQEVAKLLNLSQSYCYNLDHKLAHNSKYRQGIFAIAEQMPGIYQAATKMRLQRIANIEGKSLKAYENNPQLAIDKPALLKHMKISAGVLDEAQAPAAPRVDVQQLKVFIQNTIGGKSPVPKNLIDITDYQELTESID